MIEPLVLEGDPRLGQTIIATFARVVVCVGCKNPMGEVILDRKGFPKCWTKTSWALMTQVHPRPPYSFKLDAAGNMLIPTTYAEEAAKK